MIDPPVPMDFLRLYFDEDVSTGACGAVVVSARPPFILEISTRFSFPRGGSLIILCVLSDILELIFIFCVFNI